MIPEPSLYCSSECMRIDKKAKKLAEKRPDPKLLEPTKKEAKALGLKRSDVD